jgi:hypothetical protein
VNTAIRNAGSWWPFIAPVITFTTLGGKVMSDFIDRQALMKEFADFVRASNNSDFANTPTWNDAISLVGSMPSVAWNKRGKWIVHKIGYRRGSFDECSECGKLTPEYNYSFDYHWWTFCPYCGAYMVSEVSD